MNGWLFGTVPLPPRCETRFLSQSPCFKFKQPLRCLLLSFKVCGLEKEKELSEVPKGENILKEPGRERADEKGGEKRICQWRRCPLVKERQDVDRIAACFLHQQLRLSEQELFFDANLNFLTVYMTKGLRLNNSHQDCSVFAL